MLELARRATAGDREAFSALAADALDRMYSTAVRIVQDHDLAEDAVQAAIMRAWHDIRGLRDPACFDGWLRRLLIHACYDEAHKQRSYRAHVRVLHLEPASADPTGWLADRDELERAFQRLTVEQRSVLVLHFYDGLSLTQVAQTLGIPEGTARSRLHYALDALRGAVDAEERAMVPARRTA